MKKLIIFFWLIFITIVSLAQPYQKHIQKATELYNKKEFSKSLIHFEKALKYNSNDPYVLFNTGLAAYNSEQYIEASGFFKSSIENGIKIEDNNIFLLIADCYIIQNDLQSAIDILLNSLNYFPNDEILLAYLGDYYIQLGMYKEAIGPLLKLIEINPERSVYIRELALCYVEISDFRNAIKYAKLAVHSFPKEFKSVYRLGCTYYSYAVYLKKIIGFMDKNITDYEFAYNNRIIEFIKSLSYGVNYLEKAYILNSNDKILNRELEDIYKPLTQYGTFPEKKLFLKKLKLLESGDLKYYLLANIPSMNVYGFHTTIDGTGNISLTDLYYQKKDAIVTIIQTSEINKEISLGSGFVISTNGIVISNSHVLGDELNALVIYDNKKLKIKSIIERSDQLDYVIFQINVNEPTCYLEISQHEPKIGEETFTIGNPEGLEKTLSKGIISGIRDNNNLFQTTAEITFGSSGGPLFNMEGKVVGITTGGFNKANLNFAVNINKLKLHRFINNH